MSSPLATALPAIVSRLQNPLFSVLCVLDLCFLTNLNTGNSSVIDVTKDSSMAERLDSLDMDEVLMNSRLFSNWLKCLLDTGPCISEYKELRKEMLQVLYTGCKDCRENTKIRTKKMYTKLKMDPKYEESYKKVMSKYDPDKKYESNVDKFLQ